jgi:hypothetical protein
MPSDDHISQVSYKLVYAFLLVVKSSINKTDQYNYRQYTVLLCVTENIWDQDIFNTLNPF